MTDLVALARLVAKEFGEGWRGGRGHYSDDAIITGPSGERLQLEQVTWRKSTRGRVYIQGSLQGYRSQGYRLSNPKISVSASRPPAQIAREITRRLLPGYRDVLAEVKRRKEVADAEEAAWSQLERELLAVLTGSRYIEHSRSISYGSYGEDQCNVDVRRGDYAVFKIHVPHLYAVELAQFVQSLSKRRGASFQTSN